MGLIKMGGGFGIEMENGDYVEILLTSEVMGRVPDGVDRNTCLQVQARKAGEQSSVYWSKPIRNFDLKRR
jgi:hypothetical protein